MSDINDGGPAFPALDASQNLATGETTVHQAFYSGMTLRDYFAARALQALLRNVRTSVDVWAVDPIAQNSYAMADAMLRARKEQK